MAVYTVQWFDHTGPGRDIRHVRTTRKAAANVAQGMISFGLNQLTAYERQVLEDWLKAIDWNTYKIKRRVPTTTWVWTKSMGGRGTLTITREKSNA